MNSPFALSECLSRMLPTGRKSRVSTASSSPSASSLRSLARLLSVSLAAAATFGLAGAAHAQPLAGSTPPIKQPGQFPTAQLNIGLNLIHAEVAENEADREQGLMYRKKLAPNSGMLFVFDDVAGHCFWMKNTLIPLSIAFIAEDGTITDLDEMAAETENNHCPTHAIRYTLEMEKGWFTAHGIKPGMHVDGLNGG